jgi:hypothetical protein
VEDLVSNPFTLPEDFFHKKKYKKYHYFMTIPTCAPNIGLVVGQFDEHNDENNNEITFYYGLFNFVFIHE